MSAKSFILPAPWAHFDALAKDTEFARKTLSPETFTEVEAGVPVYLAVPTSKSVRVSGHRMGAQQLGATYELGGIEYAIWLLSVGVQPSEYQLEVEVGGHLAGGIEFKGYIPRPAFSSGDYNTSVPEERAEQLDIFLLSIIDLIQMANDPQYQDEQVVWDRILRAWTDQTAESTIPPMALIVRHARKIQSLTRDLYEKPRRILRRLRKSTPVDRVQQLDIACVRWLSRQPGRDVYEQAGPRQRILAVQRHQSMDTLENRVFTDFAKRSHRAASDYTKRYERLKNSERWNLVNIYGHRSRHINHDFRAAGVSSVQQPVVPNFVLLQDVRYRRLWRAYLELLRQSDEEDECWRWQHRLWFDYARLLIHLSLRQDSMFLRVAEAPLRIKSEQERGSWVEMRSQSGTWLTLQDDPNECVVSLIWSLNSEHSKIQSWAHGLGCHAIIHVQRLSDSREGYLAVWAYHSFCDAQPNLKTLGQSAKNAIENCKNNARLVDDIDLNLRGLIIASDFIKHGQSAPIRTEDGEVVILKTGISHAARKSMLHHIPVALINHIKAMFAN
jgi:hypothetical protein